MSDELTTPTRSAGLADRAKSIIVQPKSEWERIATETTDPKTLLTSYVLPLAAIGPIATLIGSQVFGYQFLGVTMRPGLGSALATAVVSFVLSLVSLYVVALIANFLSPKFGGKESFPAAFRLVAYAWTAAWLAGIFGLVPALAILAIVGLYSLYLLYLGAGPVMGVPQDKAVGYTVVTVLVAIVVNIAVGFIAAAITGTMGGAAVASDSVASVDLGEYGSVTVDGENSTVDLGEFGRVEVDGETARVMIDGEEVEINVEDATAAAEAAAAEARAAAE